VVTFTEDPSAVAVRKPPTSRLAAPKRLKPAASSVSVPAMGAAPEPAMRMSRGLLISTSLPRPVPSGIADTDPSISNVLPAANTRRPESIGRRGVPPSRCSAASRRNVLARLSAYSTRLSTTLRGAISKPASTPPSAVAPVKPLRRYPDAKLEPSGNAVVAAGGAETGVTKKAPGRRA